MIGVFDSGVGGLGVLDEIRRLAPSPDLLYLADHAAAPYGIRSLEEVETRSRTVATWLRNQGCDVITIACNTASAAALHPLRSEYPDIHFVGMEPALKPAARLTGSGRIGVVATAATFQGRLFASVVDRFAPDKEVVTAACPDWVHLVEQGITSGEAVREAVRTCLDPMVEKGIDVLVLGCTHYPFLRDAIEDVVGARVRIVDPSPAVARQTVRMATQRGAMDGSGKLQLVSTAGPRSLEIAGEVRRFEPAASLLPL